MFWGYESHYEKAGLEQSLQKILAVLEAEAIDMIKEGLCCTEI